MAGMFMSQIAVILVALFGCANLVHAGKCSDHLLSLSADGWSDGYESASQYGKAYIESFPFDLSSWEYSLLYKSNLTAESLFLILLFFNAPSLFYSRGNK